MKRVKATYARGKPAAGSNQPFSEWEKIHSVTNHAFVFAKNHRIAEPFRVDVKTEFTDDTVIIDRYKVRPYKSFHVDVVRSG